MPTRSFCLQFFGRFTCMWARLFYRLIRFVYSVVKIEPDEDHPKIKLNCEHHIKSLIDKIKTIFIIKETYYISVRYRSRNPSRDISVRRASKKHSLTSGAGDNYCQRNGQTCTKRNLNATLGYGRLERTRDKW